MTRETTVGHCKADSTDTYIGRGQNGRHMKNTPVGERGWLGNPYTLDDGYTRAESIDLFRDTFYDRLGADAEFREAVEKLDGDTLGCWCQREDDDTPACHGEIIADYVNGDGAETLTEQERTGGDESHSTLVKCADCQTYIELTRDENGKLTLTCDCGIQRGLKVKMALPDGWMP